MKSPDRANAKATKAFPACAGFGGCDFGGFFYALKKKQQ
jgi:hypothetical protein